MPLFTKWTAGRVVEGARLERGYRATYLGFESLAVHHQKIVTPFIYYSAFKEASTNASIEAFGV